MKVITQYPVYIDKKLVGGEDFLSLDGKSSALEIRAFQSWYNINYPFLTRLVVDGIWGNKTSSAYFAYGKTYEATLKPQTNVATGGGGGTGDGGTGGGGGTGTSKGTGAGAGIGAIVKAGANIGAGAGAEAAAAQGKQGVLNKIGDAFGLTDDKGAKPDKKGMNKTVMYVLIGVGVLAVLGITYALVKKK
jgi:hypothetical protein